MKTQIFVIPALLSTTQAVVAPEMKCGACLKETNSVFCFEGTEAQEFANDAAMPAYNSGAIDSSTAMCCTADDETNCSAAY